MKREYKQLLYFDPHVLGWMAFGGLVREMRRGLGAEFRCEGDNNDSSDVGDLGLIDDHGEDAGGDGA